MWKIVNNWRQGFYWSKQISQGSEIKEIIKKENERGVTIFLTTHNMYIADELCDRVAFIVDGKIRLIDSPKALKLKYGGKLVEVEYFKDGKLIKESFSTVVGTSW